MTPQNLSLWICWKLFWATLNPNWLELRIRRDQNTRKIVYIFASYEEKWLVQVSFWQFCWPLMLRAQLPYSRNVAEMNSWTVYHINIFGEWWTSSYWKFRHKRVNPLLKEPWRGVASTPASPLCLSVVKSVLLLTHSDALYQLFEAGVRGWQVSCASAFSGRGAAETKERQSCGEN